MRHIYGIMLIDPTTVVLRIYETDLKEWKLAYYKSTTLTSTLDSKLLEAIVDLMVSPAARKVSEWKVGARNVHVDRIRLITKATNLPVENLTDLREQELLCKGMFTELW